MGLTMLNRQNGINFFLHLSEIRKFILGIKLLKKMCQYGVL